MALRAIILSDRMIGGNSAYSKVTFETCNRLADLGHKVAHIPMGMANNMGRQTHNKVLIYPSGGDPWGEDVAIEHYIDFKADLLVTIKEPWCFNSIHRFAINFMPMAIIDHAPVSPSITSRLKTAYKVIAISRFGQRELKKVDVESTYIPHGCRTDLYRPLEHHSPKDQHVACKKMWFFDEDDFTVLIVAMNRARKMISRMLRGYARFKENNPDIKSHLMLWTDVMPPGGVSLDGAISLGVSDVGVNLLPEILNLNLGEAVRWPDAKLYRRGLPEWAGEDYKGGWDMVKLYNAADVLLNCTGGEGFSMPLIESQACGVPVITTDYAAGPENVGSGVVVPYYDYAIMNTPGTRYALPSIEDMANAIQKIANGDRAKMAVKARRFAERYAWHKVMQDYWVPLLAECETDLYPKITKEGASTWA